MGQPDDIRLVDLDAAGERVQAVALSVGNPQCVLLDDRARRVSACTSSGRRSSIIPRFPIARTCRSCGWRRRIVFAS